MRLSIACIIGIASIMASAALAQKNNTQNTLLEFFAGQGCAIGPSTKMAAVAAGFEPQEIDHLSKTARKDSGTVLTGDWLVLSPAICKIRPPKVNNKIHVSDPEVIQSIFADTYEGATEPGCFINPDSLQKLVQQTRGWDENTARLEYYRFLSASVLSGEVAFYSDDGLKTPAGFMVTTGECADIALMPQIRRNHALLIEYFDPLIRAISPHISCEYGAGVPNIEFSDIADQLTDGKNTNAWMGVELEIIALGAGWYEGIAITKRGIPRPPLCHYE